MEATNDATTERMKRLHKAQRLAELAEKSKQLDTIIWDRMSTSVKVAAGKARLGFLTVPMFVMRWPDWQLTSLYARGFRVSGPVDPSNIYSSRM